MRKFTPQTATITASNQVAKHLLRLDFKCPDIIGKDLSFTDHYVKLLFDDAGQPLVCRDAEELGQLRPTRRTYTLRDIDTEAGSFGIEFVTHGDEGIAGPWASRAQVGEQISFVGPGGAWRPEPEFERFVLAGDEAAAPAIVEAIHALPENAQAIALIEVGAEDETFKVNAPASCQVQWVYRNGATHGTQLVAALQNIDAAWHQDASWFVHGVAEMVKDIRKLLFVTLEVPKERASISGYWRLGMTEDMWQSSKKEFVAAAEQEESLARQQD